MSTEQRPDTPAAETPAADITQQVTSPEPKTQPTKNPKRVPAGKIVAERTKKACEEQKKAASEAAVIIKNNKAKKKQQKRPPQPLHQPQKEIQSLPVASAARNGWLSEALLFHLLEFITNVKSSRPSTTKRLHHNMRRNNLRPRSLNLPLLLNRKKGG